MHQWIKDIPLYQTLYGTKLESTISENSLHILPELEKTLVSKGFPNNWMSPKLKKAMENNAFEFMTTSGTTTERMTLVRPPNWWAGEEKRLHHNLSKLFPEYENQTSKAILTTAICSNNTCYTELPSYEKRIVYGILHLNISLDPNSWTAEDIQRIVQEIDMFKPFCFQADPIYLAIFFKLLKKYKIKPPLWIPHFLVLTYEYVTNYSLKLIRQFWDVPTIVLYGLTEVGFVFYRCEHGNIHPFDECLYLFKNTSEWDANIQHLFVTSFKNEYMPFINYATGDLFQTTLHNNCNCNAKTVATNFLGRLKDVTFSKKHQPITVGNLDSLLGDLETDILIYALDFCFDKQIVFKYSTINDNPLKNTQKEQITTILKTLYDKKIIFSFEKTLRPGPSGKFQIVLKR